MKLTHPILALTFLIGVSACKTPAGSKPSVKADSKPEKVEPKSGGALSGMAKFFKSSKKQESAAKPTEVAKTEIEPVAPPEKEAEKPKKGAFAGLSGFFKSKKKATTEPEPEKSAEPDADAEEPKKKGVFAGLGGLFKSKKKTTAEPEPENQADAAEEAEEPKKKGLFSGLANLFSFGKKKSGDGASAAKSGSSAAFVAEIDKIAATGGLVTGPKGWLFQASDIGKLSRTTKPNTEATNRAVSAIVDYQKQLKEKGVKLVVAVVPQKALIFSDQISKVAPPRSGKIPMRVDAHVEQTAEKLEAAGVNVVDLTPDFLVNRDANGGAFTKGSDSLTPAAAQMAAERIARTVGMRGAAGLVAKEDTTPGGNELGGEAVNLPTRQIYNKTGTGPVPMAPGGNPVVVLSDGTGTAWARERASLAEQLSYELQSPVSLLEAAESRNAPRLRIMKAATTERNPLRNAKVMVWIMESTALTSPDWKKLPLSLEFKANEPTVSTN